MNLSLIHISTSELAIDRLLKALDRHPLQGPWWQAAWHWLRQHQQWGWGALALVLLLGGHHLLLQRLFNRSQRRLLKARHQLEQKGRQLAQARRLAELGELDVYKRQPPAMAAPLRNLRLL